jgi:hypothetical protein
MKIFINIFTMDYITKYYKNLSEQLQKKVNILTKNLYEDMAPPGGEGMNNLQQPSRQQPPSTQQIDPSSVRGIQEPLLDPRWFYKTLNIYSPGNPWDAQSFAFRLNLLNTQFDTLSYGELITLFASLFGLAPGNMTGAEFFDLLEPGPQAFLTRNYTRISQLYYDNFN